MNKKHLGLSRILVCVALLSLALYSYIDKQNAVTRLRLSIPAVAKDIKDVQEENLRLRYEIELFESPQHLLQLASHREFSHLKHPLAKEILMLTEGLALQVPGTTAGEVSHAQPKPTLAMGAVQ